MGSFVNEHKPGDIVKGRITRFANFGAFVELDEGLEGLCHISELSEERVDKPEDVAQVGQEMDFRVLRIENDNKKIGLSARAASSDEPVVDTKSYSTEAKGGMASLAELGNFFAASSGGATSSRESSSTGSGESGEAASGEADIGDANAASEAPVEASSPIRSSPPTGGATSEALPSDAPHDAASQPRSARQSATTLMRHRAAAMLRAKWRNAASATGEKRATEPFIIQLDCHHLLCLRRVPRSAQRSGALRRKRGDSDMTADERSGNDSLEQAQLPVNGT